MAMGLDDDEDFVGSARQPLYYYPRQSSAASAAAAAAAARQEQERRLRQQQANLERLRRERDRAAAAAVRNAAAAQAARRDYIRLHDLLGQEERTRRVGFDDYIDDDDDGYGGDFYGVAPATSIARGARPAAREYYRAVPQAPRPAIQTRQTRPRTQPGPLRGASWGPFRGEGLDYARSANDGYDSDAGDENVNELEETVPAFYPFLFGNPSVHRPRQAQAPAPAVWTRSAAVPAAKAASAARAQQTTPSTSGSWKRVPISSPTPPHSATTAVPQATHATPATAPAPAATAMTESAAGPAAPRADEAARKLQEWARTSALPTLRRHRRLDELARELRSRDAADGKWWEVTSARRLAGAGPQAPAFLEAEERLARLVIALDGVEAGGSEAVRRRRRELVREAQQRLDILDQVKETAAEAARTSVTTETSAKAEAEAVAQPVEPESRVEQDPRSGLAVSSDAAPEVSAAVTAADECVAAGTPASTEEGDTVGCSKTDAHPDDSKDDAGSEDSWQHVSSADPEAHPSRATKDGVADAAAATVQQMPPAARHHLHFRAVRLTPHRVVRYRSTSRKRLAQQRAAAAGIRRLRSGTPLREHRGGTLGGLKRLRSAWPRIVT
ncbi:hypothetical protein HK405_005490, partial [Cladochytrium tenue]